MTDGRYHSPTLKDITLDEVIESIKQFIEENEEASYKLTIGSDSEVRTEKGKQKKLSLVNAIVIHRKGYGAKYFWRRRETANTKSLRDKIYQEVLLSIETAKMLVPQLRAKINGKSNLYALEIHVDVGAGGPTKEMINEVIGIVNGNGFVARTKPESYAASNVADKYA